MDFSTYLETLPASDLSSLYASPWTCQAVLRSLPSVSQQFVLRLLHLDTPVPDTWLNAWVVPGHEKKATEATSLLKRLRVIQCASPPGPNPASWTLEPTFKARLQQSVANPSSLGHGEATLGRGESLPTAAALSSFAEAQWESLMLVLVSDSRIKETRSRLQELGSLAKLNVAKLLYSAGLLSSPSGASEITIKGFRFLFEDVYSQLWSLMKQYLSDSSKGTGLRLSDVLSFLLQLAFRKASQPLRMDELSPGQQEVAADLACLGLLKPVKLRSGTWLCPTFLASLLCGTTSAIASAPSDVGGFILVETSFRVYAYTSSPVQISILQLFSRTECILPNVYVGTISSVSVSGALKRGINAAMIVKYLEHHRHPQVLHRVPILPEAVRDQIMLWESETNRMRTTMGYYYESFQSQAVFDKVARYAESQGVLLFVDSKAQRIVVEAHAHGVMRDFIKATK